MPVIAYLDQLRPSKDFRLDYTFVSSEAKAKLAPVAPDARRRPPGVRESGQRAEERPPVAPEYLAPVREIVGMGGCVRPHETGCAVTLYAHWSGGDEKLALLEKLGDVQYLSIKSPIADTAIPYLKKLTHLVALELEDTHISDAGMVELKKALPDTNVVRSDERQ